MGDGVRRLLASLVVLAVVFSGSAVVPRPAGATSPGSISRLAFVSDRDQASGEIYTVDTNKLGVWTRVTKNTSPEGHPVWQPNGTTIAYGSDKNGATDIWTIEVSGSGETNVTKDPRFEAAPSWSPDGTRIAYMANNATGTTDIWVMGADGSGKTQLTSSSNGLIELDPAWSPDGLKIAFASMTQSSADIFVTDAAGSKPTKLTNSSATNPLGGWQPSWSPDGTQIAYIAKEGAGLQQVYVMDADGSHPHSVTSGGGEKVGPAWSPDGLYIAFSSDVAGIWDLWLVEPDGSDLGQITNDPHNESGVSWESVNRLPVAVDDGPFTVVRGEALTGASLLVNDSDPDGDVLAATVAKFPDHYAEFTFNSNGTFRYVHDGSTGSSDSFAYRVTDGRGGWSTDAVVSIDVSDPPPPVVGGDTVGLVDPGSGVWRLRDGAGVVTQFFYGNPGDYPFMGDWDCDGTDTPGLYRQSDGFAYLRNSNTQGKADVSFFFGNPGDVPIAGDFNNDGCDTLSIYRPANQRFYVINALGQDGGGLGAADYEFLFGNPGDKPVVGDWDGDGVDEVGLHRESTGFFYYRNSLSTGVADGELFFGDPGDRFVAGDWGVVDARETPAVFRPSNQTFYFRHTMTQGNADSQFTWDDAAAGWLPIAGNFGL